MSKFIELTIHDEDVICYLEKSDNETSAALRALRVGVLAIESASGAIDVDAIRSEGGRIVEGLHALLSAHANQVASTTSSELARYLDPKTGVLEASIAKLREGSIAHVDILNGAVMAHVGEAGTVARTMTKFIGEGSPLLRLLDPGQENGLRGRIEKLLRDGVEYQRAAVLAEFSLDRPDSALSRLLRELDASNGRLTDELSLDQKDSALSRLVDRVEAAAEKSVRELSLDYEDSALTRLSSSIHGWIGLLATQQGEFNDKVLERLARLDEKKKVERTGTQHGFSFELQLLNRVCALAEEAGDVFDATGTTTGTVRNCKVGDAVVTIGEEKLGAGARVVWEAKEDAGYTRTKALEEIELGMKNRNAAFGVFVFSARTAPDGTSPVVRHGSRLLVLWDQDDPASDLNLTAAHTIATALLAREASDASRQPFDFTEVDRELADIDKQVARVAAIREKCETIRRAAASIEEEARVASDKIGTSAGRLVMHVRNLKRELE